MNAYCVLSTVPCARDTVVKIKTVPSWSLHASGGDI